MIHENQILGNIDLLKLHIADGEVLKALQVLKRIERDIKAEVKEARSK